MKTVDRVLHTAGQWRLVQHTNVYLNLLRPIQLETSWQIQLIYPATETRPEETYTRDSYSNYHLAVEEWYGWVSRRFSNILMN